MAEGVAADQDTKPRLLRFRGKSGQQGPRFKIRVLGVGGPHQMIREPEAFPAELLEPRPSLACIPPGPILDRLNAERARSCRRWCHADESLSVSRIGPQCGKYIRGDTFHHAESVSYTHLTLPTILRV